MGVIKPEGAIGTHDPTPGLTASDVAATPPQQQLPDGDGGWTWCAISRRRVSIAVTAVLAILAFDVLTRPTQTTAVHTVVVATASSDFSGSMPDASGAPTLPNSTTTAASVSPSPSEPPTVAPRATTPRRLDGGLLIPRPCGSRETLAACLMRVVTQAPLPCTVHQTLLIFTGSDSQGRSVENVVRAATAAHLCPNMIAVLPPTSPQCRARVSNISASSTPAAIPVDSAWLERPTHADENGADSRGHVEERKGCSIESVKPVQYPVTYFGWLVRGFCMHDEAQMELIVTTLSRMLNVSADATHVINVTASATFRYDGVAFRRRLCMPRNFCAGGPAREACKARRNQIARMRTQLAKRDVFGVSVPFADRVAKGSAAEKRFFASGTVSDSPPIDTVPLSCGAIRATIVSEAEAAVIQQRPPTISVAIAMSGAIRTLQATVPRNAEMLKGFPSWFYFVNVVTAFPVTAPSDVEGARVLFSQPNLLAGALLDRLKYPTQSDVERDHPLAAYKASREDVRSIPDALLQYLNVYLAGRFRQMYETRCGFRFDVTIRMRTDAYLSYSVPSDWLRFDSETLWVDRDRDFGGLNDQWWAGPSRLIDRLMDTYFQVPNLMVTLGSFHAETVVKQCASMLLDGATLRRPKHRVSELHRSLDDPIGKRWDQLHSTAVYCDRTKCDYPDP